jgi:hypothetical protein
MRNGLKGDLPDFGVIISILMPGTHGALVAGTRVAAGSGLWENDMLEHSSPQEDGENLYERHNAGSCAEKPDCGHRPPRLPSDGHIRLLRPAHARTQWRGFAALTLPGTTAKVPGRPWQVSSDAAGRPRASHALCS